MSVEKNHSSQIEIIKKSFDRKKKENSRLSIRWLAQSLNLSPPMMTRIMNGERKLPANLVPKIGQLLDIDRDDQDRLLKELLNSKGYSQESMKAVFVDQMEGTKEPIPWARATNEAFDLFKAWYLIAILDTTLLKKYDGTIEYISRKLKLDVKLVEDAFKELIKVGMLELRDGKYKKSNQFLELRTTQNFASIRKLHIDQLEKIKKQLETRTSDEDRAKRFVTGITVTTSQEKMNVARIKIAEFMQELTKDLASGEPEEVYHFAVQLYPLT